MQISKTTNCTRPTGSYNFVSLWKNLVVLIFSKLHSKLFDYLYKQHSSRLLRKVDLNTLQFFNQPDRANCRYKTHVKKISQFYTSVVTALYGMKFLIKHCNLCRRAVFNHSVTIWYDTMKKKTKDLTTQTHFTPLINWRELAIKKQPSKLC